MRDGKVTGFIHLFSIHKREGESLKASVNMHKVEGGDWSGLGNESNVSGDEISGANLIDEDGGLEVVSFCEEMVEGVGKLRGKNDCFPFSMVSGGIKVSHGVMEAFVKVGVRRGRSRGLRAFGQLGG